MKIVDLFYLQAAVKNKKEIWNELNKNTFHNFLSFFIWL